MTATLPAHTGTFLVAVAAAMVVLVAGAWLADRARHRCPWCDHARFADVDQLAAHVHRCHHQ